jgi:hypothetical protein
MSLEGDTDVSEEQVATVAAVIWAPFEVGGQPDRLE